MDIMYYIGLDVHKRTISYCVKGARGQVHQEGKIDATRRELDGWMETLPQPWTVAMEATIFTGGIYDHLLPHAQQFTNPTRQNSLASRRKWMSRAWLNPREKKPIKQTTRQKLERLP